MSDQNEESKTVLVIRENTFHKQEFDHMIYLLKEEGFEIIEALGLEPGLSIIKNGKISVVIIDLMAVSDRPLDIYQKVKKATDIPIIVTTDQLEISSRIPKEDKCLTKPFKAQELVECVQEMFERLYQDNDTQDYGEGDLI